MVSTHSRPKAAGTGQAVSPSFALFQHTAARRRLATTIVNGQVLVGFQHTAARRRLASLLDHLQANE